MTTASTGDMLQRHVADLKRCRRCEGMIAPPVASRAVSHGVLLVGQAPGDKEPKLARPFAWTAGKTLFQWFEKACGIDEARFREHIYMAAVCRCFPGKKPRGGDRVPNGDEIAACRPWLEAEFDLIRPSLVIPVGKLAISQFLPDGRLEELIGRRFESKFAGRNFIAIPLPHPSGASPWPRIQPGKSLLAKAMTLIAAHPAMARIRSGV